eukprot:326069_1
MTDSEKSREEDQETPSPSLGVPGGMGEDSIQQESEEEPESEYHGQPSRQRVDHAKCREKIEILRGELHSSKAENFKVTSDFKREDLLRTNEVARQQDRIEELEKRLVELN